MRRRTYIATLGSGGIGAVAGCTESGSISGTPEPADLQVDSVEFTPTSIQLREETTIEVTVTNYGEANGQGELWYRSGRSTDSFVVDIDGGGSETYTKTISSSTRGEFELQLDPARTTGIRNLSHTATVKVESKLLTYGDSWKNNEGYTITIDDPHFRQSYEARSSWSGDVETYEPEDEELFAFVPVTAENDGDGSGTVPIPGSFFARVEGELYDLGIRPSLKQPDFRGELNGEELYTSGEIPPGTSKSGLLVFEVPVAALDDFQSGWSSRYGDDEVVYWE